MPLINSKDRMKAKDSMSELTSFLDNEPSVCEDALAYLHTFDTDTLEDAVSAMVTEGREGFASWATFSLIIMIDILPSKVIDMLLNYIIENDSHSMIRSIYTKSKDKLPTSQKNKIKDKVKSKAPKVDIDG